MKVSGMPRGIWLCLESDHARRIQDRLYIFPGIQKPIRMQIPVLTVVSHHEMQRLLQYKQITAESVFTTVSPYLHLISFKLEKVVYSCNKYGKRSFSLQVHSGSMQIMRNRIARMYGVPSSIYEPKGPTYYLPLGYEGTFTDAPGTPTHTLKGIDLS